MKNVFRNLMGRQTVINVCLAFFLTYSAVRNNYDFIIISTQHYVGHFIVAGLIVLIALTQLHVNKARKKSRIWAFDRFDEALRLSTRTFSFVGYIVGVFCSTTAISLIAYWNIASTFSDLWMFMVPVLSGIIWCLVIFLSVWVYQKMFYNPPEETLDEIFLREQGDF